MTEPVCVLRVTLTTGEKRLLTGGGTADEAAARITDLEHGTGEFEGDWCHTHDAALIAKAHIVEASVVPLPHGLVRE